MLTRSEMEFVPGTILRKEMLSDLYSYPRMVTESLFAGFSNGILYGLEWVEESSDRHIIKPGALKLHGKVYFMDSFLNVEETLGALSDGTRYRLYFREKKECSILKDSLNIFDLELKPVLTEECGDADKDGFYYAYILFSDGKIREIWDSSNIGGLFASDDEYGFKLPPEIVKESLKPVYKEKPRKHILDYLMLKDLSENKPLSVGFVKMYLDEAGFKCVACDCKDPMKLLCKLKEACEKLKPEAGIQAKEPLQSIKTNEKQYKEEGSL